jgi:Fe-S cluster assembly iron-binding protein IscA
MFEVSELATAKLTEYLDQNNLTSAIRVAAMSGCSGPALGLALDEQKENDATVQIGDLNLLIDNDLISILGTVTIDFVEPTESGCGCGGGGGFQVTSTNPLPGSGGGCGNDCASGCGC